MKAGAALLLSAALAALCGSLAAGNGVCYDPDHAGSAKSEASIIADMAAVRAKGFTHVRTYIAKFGNTDMARIIRDQGMTLAIGVPYGNPDYATQLEAALTVAKGGNVQYIFIGNENLRGSVPASFIQEIRNVKARVPAGVKVGTVQRNTEFLENIGGLSDLINACDAIGINIHPFFTPGQNGATNAIELTKNHWNRALALAGDKLVLGETGWPSAGSVAGNQGSREAASSYFSAYNSWGAVPGDKRFYFQMFDQPQRTDGLFEQTFGLLTSGRQDKFAVAVSPPAAPVVVSTPAPTAAPTTAAAPTTTPTPTSTVTSTPTPTATPSTTTAAPTTAPTPTPTATPVVTPAAANATSSSSAVGSSSTDELTGSGSADFGSDTGIEGSSQDTSATKSTTTNADGTSTTNADGTSTAAAATTIESNGHGDPVIASDADNANYAGGGKTNGANTQSSSSGGGGAAVAFAVAAGCVAVLGAFGFIYHTRKKAAALEEAEAKPSMSVTPHGGCVL